MRVIFISMLLLMFVPMKAQHSYDSVINEIKKQKRTLTDFPNEIVRKQEQVSANITKQNIKILNKLFKYERKILKGIKKEDNRNCDDLLNTCDANYSNIINLCKQPARKNELAQYDGHIDSIETVLQFLKMKQPGNEKFSKAIESIDFLKGKIYQSEMITQFIADKQNILKSLAGKYSNLPGGVIKSVEKYSMQFQDYKKQVASWKSNLTESMKLEERVLEILNRIPAFKSFWQENSQLAKLFGGSSVAIPSSAGLQSRQSVAQELQRRFGLENADPQQILQLKLQSANKELNVLKSKINQLKEGNAGNDAMGSSVTEPGNPLSKSHVKKLDFGFNLQKRTKAAYNFPVSNELGLSVGYKFNEKIETGIGMSYKFGLGTSWKKIKFSHEGIGLRSYIDLKISPTQNGVHVLFSNIWISGGYEQNYWRIFKNFPGLKQVAWQPSGLIGISKRIQVDNKFFKYAKMQVLWDFLSFKQATVSQPVVFRIGYVLK